MITTEQIRSLLTIEQLEQFIQGTPEGTSIGVAADVAATDESDWAHNNVVALSLAASLHVPEVCVWITHIVTQPVPRHRNWVKASTSSLEQAKKKDGTLMSRKSSICSRKE